MSEESIIASRGGAVQQTGGGRSAADWQANIESSGV